MTPVSYIKEAKDSPIHLFFSFLIY